MTGRAQKITKSITWDSHGSTFLHPSVMATIGYIDLGSSGTTEKEDAQFFTCSILVKTRKPPLLHIN